MEEIPDNFTDFAEHWKPKVYQRVLDHLPDDVPDDYLEMLRSYTDRQGRYRRPTYLILWNMLYGGDPEECVLPAAAQQASQDYFLIHDDWMDNADLRRGEPAAHVLFGSTYAMLAGDHLHTVVWKIAKNACDQWNDERSDRYFDKFYDIMHTTHRGQYLDLSLTAQDDITDFTEEDYYESIHAKSAYYSVYGPMQCGAIIAGASEKKVEAMKEFGTYVGNAFQMKDDILDATSTEEETGKSVGNDVREGVKTIILWHAVQNASDSELEELQRIYSKDREDKTDEEVQWVLDKFDELGSVDYAQDKAKEFTDKAVEIFEEQTEDIPESPLKQLARESIGYVAERHE